MEEEEFSCESFCTNHPVFNNLLLERILMQIDEDRRKTDAPTDGCGPI